MQILFLYIFVGLLGISNIVLCGIYGDLLIESFSFKKVVRSLLLGITGAIYLYWINNNLPLFIVALNVVTLERITTEIYKALIRNEQQAKYLIPSDLNINLPRSFEKSLGVFLIILILVLFKVVNFNVHTMVIILFAAFLPAIAGMLKDAPYEGFYPLKFFRSPLVISIMAVFLIYFFPELKSKYFLFGMWGGERIICEGYKKIIRGGIPGKFKKDMRHHIKHSWRVNRKYLLIPYLTTVISFIFLLCLSLNSNKN